VPTEPRLPQSTAGTTGVIHIIRQNLDGQSSPSEFLVSFGGKKDGIGAFYLGKAVGLDPLTALLQKLGVSVADVDTALRALMAEPHHRIPDVTLTSAMIRELGL
jgi:hypothetical protein